ncbi:MAG: hypothetical protein K6T78_05595 [Alicyclobacillus sp.]|nr:hypothetical protein [Alicyclobacillus sp.]
MRTLRTVYRLIRWGLLAYGFVNAVLRSRWFAVLLAMLRMLAKRRLRPARRVAAFQFVDGSEPAIYRRAGWRRIPIREMTPDK